MRWNPLKMDIMMQQFQFVLDGDTGFLLNNKQFVKVLKRTTAIGENTKNNPLPIYSVIKVYRRFVLLAEARKFISVRPIQSVYEIEEVVSLPQKEQCLKGNCASDQ
ncbi:hypothetical protein TNCV_1624621 [Trichonephila clavipes]|nr:hypothetical protein TNCV_1624621 [Trichonephila clavipes]